ncbi:hypothetical protein [Saccharothrix syringae]|nr:hypothetical protein [Saccharothrix syringae]
MLLQTEEEAALAEHAQGHPSPVISSDARLALQIADREKGTQPVIRFARELAGAAPAFADRCEALATVVGTTPDDVAKAVNQ